MGVLSSPSDGLGLPNSYLWLVAIIAVYTLFALAPLRRPWPLGFVSFILGYTANEIPFVAFYLLGISIFGAVIEGGMVSVGGWSVVVGAVITGTGLVEIIRRQLLAGSVVEHSLDQGLGSGWRSIRDPRVGPSLSRLVRVLLVPFPLWFGGVKRIRNVRYGDDDRRQRLDLYLPRSASASSRPVLIHFHGGHFRSGGKSREGRPMFHRLARRGWICVSADYRLRDAGRFPNSLIDVKKVITWIRRHRDEYSVDASTIVVAGSSAGAHLASMTALTPNNPAFQPGFEHDDTSVAGAVCLYGYYGPREVGGAMPSSPLAYLNPDAPPFLVAHGESDTLVPVSSAAQFVERLRSTSTEPVVYVQLPGAQHSFDLYRSLRLERVINAIEVFGARIRERPQ